MDGWASPLYYLGVLIASKKQNELIQIQFKLIALIGIYKNISKRI